MAITYFSIDIEADGTHPGTYSMSSFGAVACQSDNEPVDIFAPENGFYRELKPVSSLFEPATAAVAGFDRDVLINEGADPQEAITEFIDWVNTTSNRLNPGSKPVFVGWPLSYDWMWMYWYMMKYASVSPFGHSSAIDMKTWFSAKTNIPLNEVRRKNVYKHLNLKPLPHTHNALDDAREQGQVWQSLIKL